MGTTKIEDKYFKVIDDKQAQDINNANLNEYLKSESAQQEQASVKKAELDEGASFQNDDRPVSKKENQVQNQESMATNEQALYSGPASGVQRDDVVPQQNESLYPSDEGLIGAGRDT